MASAALFFVPYQSREIYLTININAMITILVAGYTAITIFAIITSIIAIGKTIANRAYEGSFTVAVVSSIVIAIYIVYIV